MFLYTMIKSFSKTPKSKTPKILYFGKDRPERTILLIAGTHGNEPAGSIYLTDQSIIEKIKDCAKDYNIKIIVIPKVNEQGFILNKRKVPDPIPWDLNRAYPKKGDQGVRKIINTYLPLINQAQLVVDLHEAKGFRKITKGTKGSGIYSNEYGNSSTIVQKMIQNVNNIIDNQDHCFVTDNLEAIPGSLRYYCTEHEIPYILVETTVIEPIETRLTKLDNIITTLLSTFA